MAANDNQKLLISVEADIKQIRNQMKKIPGLVDVATTKSQRKFDGLTKTIADMEKGTGSAGRAIRKMQQDLAFTARKSVEPLKLNNMQLQNMQFQINDLAQGLATGHQSPFTLITQQGSQIAQIFGPGASIQMALKSTGSAIASFLTNPINLAVIGIAGAAAVAPKLWEAFVGPEARTAKDVLSDIDVLIDEVGKSYEEAGKKARSFIQKAAGPNDLLAGLFLGERDVAAQLSKEIEKISARVQEFRTVQSDSVEDYFNIQPVSEGMEKLLNTVDQLNSKQITVEKFKETIGRIVVNPEADDEVAQLAEELRAASKEALQLERRMAAISVLSDGVTGKDKLLNRFNIDTGRLRPDVFEKLRNGLKNQADALTRKPAKSADQRAREREIKTVEREQQAIAKFIETLQQEISLVGASTLERLKANNSRRLGNSATDEQIAKVMELTEVLHREKQARQQVIQTQNFFASGAFDGISAIIDKTKSASDAMKDFARSIAKAALQAALLGSGPLGGLFGAAAVGGGPGGLFGALLGGIFGRAGGGGVSSQMPYLVGERGPELFIPQTAGRIAANQNISGGSVTNVYHINAPNSDRAAIEDLKRTLTQKDRTEAKRVNAYNHRFETRKLRG